jgi:hypothetical protein
VETIAHLKENGRIVVMFCAFEGPPRIVRLHGRGQVTLLDEPGFDALAEHFEDGHGPGVRAVITVDVERVADSCGYAVPLMGFEAHRAVLDDWSERKGREGIRDYWAQKNATSIDGAEGITA